MSAIGMVGAPGGRTSSSPA